MSYYICKDLIDEIIRRLPPKSLIRCRSLSKSWYSRISSHNFIRKYAIQSAKTPQKVIVRTRVHYKKSSIDVLYTLDPEDHYTDLKSVKFPHPNDNFQIIGSCNGILLVYDRLCSLSLWNPSIRRKLNVPKHPSGCFALGFGFNPITDDYNIVGIPFSNSKGDVKSSFIYSMKTNSWNDIASYPTKFSHKYVKSLACFVNGTLHWVVKCESNNILGHNSIVTFNLSTHIFSTIQLPQPSWVTGKLTTVKGCLAVISRNGYDSWIWVRKEYSNDASWSNPIKLTNPQLEGVEGTNNYLEGLEDYNHESGVRTRLASSLDSSYIIERDMCVESLELLDNEAW